MPNAKNIGTEKQLESNWKRSKITINPDVERKYQEYVLTLTSSSFLSIRFLPDITAIIIAEAAVAHLKDACEHKDGENTTRS